MNSITLWYRKLKDLIGHGKTGALIRGFLFVNFSVILGMWLGLKVFLPDDFILSKINERLFIKDMGLVAEDVDVSIFGNVSIYEGNLTEKGEKTISFYELKFSPSLTDLIFGDISGTVYLDDINNQGGEVELSFETGENPCYSLDLNEAPLSVVKPFMSDISLVGEISGEAEICQNEKKTYDGFIEFEGKDVVFRGKFPTPMGPLNIGKIELGSIDISSEIKKSVMSIGRFITDGLFSIDIAGKANLNAKNFNASRVNLDVRIKAPDKKKIEKNPTLNLAIGQMSKYKKGKDNYAFLLKGRVSKPRLLNAPDKRVMKTDKVKKDKKDKKSRKKINKKSRKKPKRRSPKKRTRTKPPKREKKAVSKEKRAPHKRKKDLMKRAAKPEDEVDEEEKRQEDETEKDEVEKEEAVKEEVEKEEDEPEAEEEELESESEEKDTKKEPAQEKKEKKGNDEDEEDEE